MIRYRLDDLGWYQFEWLVQTLLKAQCGLAIESWGGRGDFGRDAYAVGPLAFPEKGSSESGPFVFQAKFIENANAAGAKPGSALISAVEKEAQRIVERAASSVATNVRHYALFTNAPLTPALREDIGKRIAAALPDTQVRAYGGGDLCDTLDIHPQLKRAFPQLLGLRDLNALLQGIINKEALERSRTAIACARDTIQAFVPTKPYLWAWQVVRDHGFVVLDGPPEMGKTAIAWAIALAQLAQGWQAVVCDSPEDFFRCYEAESRQVFVADDAFGRTEYDPSRGRKWETQLERILRHVDAEHWFIWTSRRHIFERARKDMDLQGLAAKFPATQEVIVDATRLSQREKALILYRQAREGGLDTTARSLVRSHARLIVGLSEFTPERIRRLVADRLPELSRLPPSEVTRRAVQEITDAIKNPTERMRRAFQSLPVEHKVLLAGLLESGGHSFTNYDEVKRMYVARVPSKGDRFDEFLDELTESFVRVTRLVSALHVSWIHPSYRDLVIEEVGSDPQLRNILLATITLEGIKLAISDTGGEKGDRSYPLMGSSESWEILRKRCVTLIREARANSVELLNMFRSAADNAKTDEEKARLLGLLRTVCSATQTYWDADSVNLTSEELFQYCNASSLLAPLPPLPHLEKAWGAIETQIVEALPNWEKTDYVDSALLKEWSRFIALASKHEPRLLRQRHFPETQRELATRIVHALGEELNVEFSPSNEDECRLEATRSRTISEALTTLEELGIVCGDAGAETASAYEQRWEELDDKADNWPSEEHDDSDYSSPPSSGDSIDIDSLFSDL